MRHKLPLGEWSRQIHKVGGHQLFTAADIQLMLGEISAGYLAARDLADTLHTKHFKKPNSPFASLNTIAGVIGQINNMTARLVKVPEKIPTQSLHLRRAEVEGMARDVLLKYMPLSMIGECSSIAYEIIREIWTRGLSLEQSAGAQIMSDEPEKLSPEAVDSAFRAAMEARQRRNPGMDTRKAETSIFDRREKLDEVTAIATAPGNAQANDYMHGMANGLILAQALLWDKEPAFIEAEKPAPTSQREQSFIDRMEIEHKELCVRIEALRSFLGSTHFNNLDGVSKDWLREQFDHMRAYRDILEARIARAMKTEAHGQVSSSDNAAGFEDLQDAAPGDGDNVSWPGEADISRASLLRDPTRVAAQLAHNVVTGEEMRDYRITGGGKSETPVPFDE